MHSSLFLLVEAAAVVEVEVGVVLTHHQST
jgi:hypothetical protein